MKLQLTIEIRDSFQFQTTSRVWLMLTGKFDGTSDINGKCASVMPPLPVLICAMF